MAINRATSAGPGRPAVDSEILEGACEHRDDPLDELIARERAQRLWEGLGRLKTLDRETLVAFYIQGRSLVEIAEALEAPIGTIKRRLHIARKRLKALLQAGVADADDWADSEDEEDAELRRRLGGRPPLRPTRGPGPGLAQPPAGMGHRAHPGGSPSESWAARSRRYAAASGPEHEVIQPGQGHDRPQQDPDHRQAHVGPAERPGRSPRTSS